MKTGKTTNSMKEVYNTPEQIKVQELKNILDDNGIDCIVVEKNSPYVDASGNLTTYSVSVNDEDFDKANELFAAFKNQIKNSACLRHALPKSRLTQSSTRRYSSACSRSMPSITLVDRVWPGLVYVRPYIVLTSSRALSTVILE